MQFGFFLGEVVVTIKVVRILGADQVHTPFYLFVISYQMMFRP